MRIAFVVATALLVCGSIASAAAAAAAPTSIPTTKATGGPDDEIVIRNGRIVDGTGNAWFYGDVLVRGNKIVAIGKVDAKPIAEVIDASGLVVAPGFIDVHTHADSDAIGSRCENFIRNGVTTLVVGTCGGSPRDVGQ